MLMAVPVLAVFGRARSADAVFAEYLDKVWRLLELNNPDDVFCRRSSSKDRGSPAAHWRMGLGGVIFLKLRRQRGCACRNKRKSTLADRNRHWQPDVLFAPFVLIQFAHFRRAGKRSR
jgi:hypothetical protein